MVLLGRWLAPYAPCALPRVLGQRLLRQHFVPGLTAPPRTLMWSATRSQFWAARLAARADDLGLSVKETSLAYADIFSGVCGIPTVDGGGCPPA